MRKFLIAQVSRGTVLWMKRLYQTIVFLKQMSCFRLTLIRLVTSGTETERMRYQQTLQCVYKYNSLTPPEAHREVCFGGQLFKHCLGGLSEEFVCSLAQSELLANAPRRIELCTEWPILLWRNRANPGKEHRSGECICH